MSEPWFDPNLFAASCGGVGSSLLGVLVGVAGGVGGDLARQGRRAPWVGRVLGGVLVAGVAGLAAGGFAWAVGQPAGIWVALSGMGLLWCGAAIGVRRKPRELHENALKGIAGKSPAPNDRERRPGSA